MSKRVKVPVVFVTKEVHLREIEDNINADMVGANAEAELKRRYWYEYEEDLVDGYIYVYPEDISPIITLFNGFSRIVIRDTDNAYISRLSAEDVNDLLHQNSKPSCSCESCKKGAGSGSSE